MKIVAIINEGSSQNLGDQAINYSLRKLCRHFGWETVSWPYSKKYRVNGIVEQDNQRGFNFLKLIPSSIKDFVFKKKLYLTKMKEIDSLDVTRIEKAIIGGGQLLNLSRAFPTSLYAWAKSFHKTQVPFYIAGVGYGKSWNRKEKKMLYYSLKNAESVFFRDQMSIKRIKDEVNFSASFVYDFAFTISDFIPPLSKKPKSICILPPSYEMVYKKYGGNKTEDEYVDYWLNLIQNYVDNGYSVSLSLTHKIRDKGIVDAVAKACAEKKLGIDVQIPHDLQELANIISSNEEVYSGRMHALIIGYSYGCKCHVQEVSQKLVTFKQEIVDSSVSLHEIKNNIYQNIDMILNS